MYRILVLLSVCSVGHCFVPYLWNPKDPFQGETLEDVHSNLLTHYAEFPDTSHLLVRLLMKEKQLRQKLETDLQTYIEETEAEIQYEKYLEDRIKDVGDFIRKRNESKEVAFSARLTKSLEDIDRAQTVVFASVVTNVGGEYDPNTGKFHCPVDGLYQFFVSILSRKQQRIKTEMVVNGRRNLMLYSSGDGLHRGSLGMNSVTMKLEKGDLVWVRMYHGFGDYIHCCWSTFTGLLLREL